MSARPSNALRRWIRVVVGSSMVFCIVLISGCSPSPRAGAPDAATTSPTPRKLEAVRWWSDAVGKAGSTISTADPTGAAVALKPDAPTYCAALSATVGSGKSVFTGGSGTDPAIVTSTKAWIAELTALAPTTLTASWKTFGDYVLSLLQTMAKPSGAKFPTQSPNEKAALAAASAAIGQQSKTDCKVDIFPSADATAPTSSAAPIK